MTLVAAFKVAVQQCGAENLGEILDGWARLYSESRRLIVRPSSIPVPYLTHLREGRKGGGKKGAKGGDHSFRRLGMAKGMRPSLEISTSGAGSLRCCAVDAPTSVQTPHMGCLLHWPSIPCPSRVALAGLGPSQPNGKRVACSAEAARRDYTWKSWPYREAPPGVGFGVCSARR